LIVQRAGFNPAFLFLAGMATLALGIFWILIPETKKSTAVGNGDDAVFVPQSISPHPSLLVRGT
jgi:predicted MFS family arabinose efflux permease